MRITLFIVFLLYPFFGFSQNHAVDTVFARTTLNEAIELQGESRYDEAISLYEKAFLMYERANVWGKMLECKNRKMTCLVDLNQFEEALTLVPDISAYHNRLGSHPEIAMHYNILGNVSYYSSRLLEASSFFEKALAMRKEVYGDVHAEVMQMVNSLAVVSLAMGKFNEGLHYLETFKETLIALGLENDPMLSLYYNNAGYVHEQRGDLSKALEHYKKSLEMHLVHQGTKSPRVVNAYNNIGNVLMSQGAFDQGLEYHRKSLATVIEVFGENHLDAARSYNNIGNIYEAKKEYMEAIRFHKKSLVIKEALLGKDNANTAVSYENLGSNYMWMGAYDKALLSTRKSLEVRMKFLGPDNPVIADTYLDIAAVYNKKKEYVQELDLLTKALRIFTESFGPRSGKVSKTQQLLAYNAMYTDTTAAMEWINLSIQSNLMEGRSIEDFEKEPTIEYFMNQILIVEALYEKAAILTALGSWKGALDTFFKLSKLIDQIREGFLNQTDKVYLSTQSKQAYGDAVLLCESLYKKTGRAEYLDGALYFSHKSKAATLHEAATNQKAKYFADIPDSLIQREKQLKIDLAFNRSLQLEESLQTNGNSAKLRYYADVVFNLKRELEEFNETLTLKFPKYHALRYGTSKVYISDLQEKLPENTTLLDFIDLDSLFVAFVITSKSAELKRVFVSNSLAQQVRSINMALEENNVEVFSKMSVALYQQLFEPLGIKTEKLIIIPDGSVWNVNFDILLTQTSEGTSFDQLAYLINDYEVTYAYSTNTLLDKSPIPTLEPQKECLAFSFENEQSKSGNSVPISQVRASNDSDLPGTRAEIRAISNFIDGTYYFGDQASEHNFKKEVRDYKIIHLALHGDIDQNNPMNSRLRFTPTRDSPEDGFLHAFEMYGLELNAELAVLSACNTGVGELVQGEGIMSLARAFAYAGCQSLIMSQWDVSDKSTPAIMEAFYKHLKEGKTKSGALRAAKLEYLNGASINLANPYHWATLVHLGDNKPILKKPAIPWIGVLIGMSIILLSVFYYYRKK